MKPIDQLQEEPFSTEELKRIREGIFAKYTSVADDASGLFAYPTGQEGARKLGYPDAAIRECPEQILKSFCGVGNPHLVKAAGVGETVLDIGCGAGFDLFVTAMDAGPSADIHGVDLTREMVDTARRGLESTRFTNISVHHVQSEELPFADDSFDLVISNGVINLSPRKIALFKEILRVLKPGGRLQFADIILARPLPPELAGSVESWSQ